jgi:hypothetical protein
MQEEEKTLISLGKSNTIRLLGTKISMLGTLNSGKAVFIGSLKVQSNHRDCTQAGTPSHNSAKK